MYKILFAIVMMSVASHGAAFAACSSEDAMTKSSDVSEVLGSKVQAKPDEASKMMTEMGNLMGGTINDQTCANLDALMVRAKKL